MAIRNVILAEFSYILTAVKVLVIYLSEDAMKKYEYKTITLDQKGWGLIKSREVPDLEAVLNREARDGWRLKEIILPSAAFGESDRIIVIFERVVE